MTTLIERGKGWVVINIGHPMTGNKYIVGETFSKTRTKAISKFISGSNSTWLYWKTNYNFRVVRSEQTVTASI